MVTPHYAVLRHIRSQMSTKEALLTHLFEGGGGIEVFAVTVHHWAFSAIAASCSLWNSSFHFAFFSMFWTVRDSFLPAACYKKQLQIRSEQN